MMDYKRKGKMQPFPILEFIEGEVFDNGKNYFRLGTNWFFLSAQYIAKIHEQFSKLIKSPTLVALSKEEITLLKTPLDPKLEELEGNYFFGSEVTVKKGKKFFDMMRYTSDKVYLYFLKAGLNHTTRQLRSEMQYVATQLSKALSPKTPLETRQNIITKFYEKAKCLEKTKKKISSFTKMQFCKIFQIAAKNQQIHFVAAIIDTKAEECQLERERQVQLHWTVEDLENEGISYPESTIERLKKDGYLRGGYVTDLFFQAKKEDFPPEDQEAYSILEKYGPKLRSITTKASLISTGDWVKKCEFHFHIAQIASDPSINAGGQGQKTSGTVYQKKRRKKASPSTSRLKKSKTQKLNKNQAKNLPQSSFKQKRASFQTKAEIPPPPKLKKKRKQTSSTIDSFFKLLSSSSKHKNKKRKKDL